MEGCEDCSRIARQLTEGPHLHHLAVLQHNHLVRLWEEKPIQRRVSKSQERSSKLPAKRLDEGTYPLDGRQAVGDDSVNGDIQSCNVTVSRMTLQAYNPHGYLTVHTMV
jgi:hypothetical protein